jgi:hypothetical protein
VCKRRAQSHASAATDCGRQWKQARSIPKRLPAADRHFPKTGGEAVEIADERGSQKIAKNRWKIGRAEALGAWFLLPPV